MQENLLKSVARNLLLLTGIPQLKRIEQNCQKIIDEINLGFEQCQEVQLAHIVKFQKAEHFANILRDVVLVIAEDVSISQINT